MYFGCAWYPEHWDESVWPQDLSLMKAAEMNVVRVGEFAWSQMEPREGEFCFDWLEAAVARAAQQGLKTVLGTPTAAPPAWLTESHPEVLREERDGRAARHGGRGHFNPASLVYLNYCRRIAGEMARRFGQNPNVIGWQIDNEYWPFSYDAGTRAQFQQFLKGRYGTLDELNRCWTTAYWSQEYSSWSQIPLDTGWQNPCLVTAFRQFFTEVYQRYQHNQIEALRAHAAPSQFITHNFHGRFEHGDIFDLGAELDHISWDPYVGSGHLEPFEMGLKHDMVRGFKRRNFWVMETQPGFVQWSPLNNPLDRGEVRAMAWHLCAHGADAVLYWQWRSALGGQEQLHGTIVGPSGRPRPLYQEIVQTGQEFRRLAALLDGTAPRARVALVWTFESRDALLGQKHHKDFDPTAHLLAYYRALRAIGLNVDVIHAGVPLEGYALVVAPHLYLLDDALANHLLNYVRGGGRLWLGMRTGMKDRHNALLSSLQPGQVLGPALGAHVEEFYALEEPVPVSGPLGTGTAAIFAEWLAVDAPGAEVLLRYSGHSWLDGQPAFVTRPCERGRVSYLGAWLDAPLMQRAAAWALRDVPLPRPPVAELPQGVEYASRGGTGCELCFFINHTREARPLRLTETLDDAFTMQRTHDELVLPPRGVAVLVKL